MSFFKNYRTPFGYVADGNQVDAYGVDHSGFSTRDEVEYQFARQEREKQMADNLKQQGIEPENYPQLGTTFWGNNPENNYGFGTSNISANIKSMQNQYINSALFPKSMANDDMVYKVAQNNLGNKTDTSNGYYDENFYRVFNKTLGEEGGYEDRPNKIDTATNMGFQQATLERFKQKHPKLSQGFPDHVKNLTREQGRIIALKDYYEPYRIGEIKSPSIQETMFDSFFNHSPHTPALWAQKAINQNTKMQVNEDGIFGSETINALNQLSEDEIIKVNNAILAQRLADHEREKKTNPNPYYEKYTVGLPSRFKRFEIK